MGNALRVPVTLLLFLLLALPATAAPLVNRLRDHASPYLALHAADPVAWQEWNAATVARARAEGKLLYLSIGYFACHWCHVMRRESYRNPEIARFLNEHFIPVKIDRELEPALDRRLITFAEATRGRSGWPLNVFVTPDGHPLYATLYHPPQEFLAVVTRVDDLWHNDRARLAALARTEATSARGPGRPEAVPAVEAERLADQVVAAVLARADGVQGGFGEQGKFPRVPQLAFLLAHYERSPDARVREFLLLTLDAMAQNGLHDHLGGGFFRYTVDPSWQTPHFEKMLYDNAQLARLYLDAARVFARDDYRRIATGTLDFLLAEMRDAQGSAAGGGMPGAAMPEGAFIAALSALDARGVEGGYYLWSAQELETLLSPGERAVWRVHAGMTDAPPFEAGWLPWRALPAAEVAQRLQREPAEVARLITAAADKLRAARTRRDLPRDTKVLAAWNGLALAAFVDAVRVTPEPRYRDAARAVRDYLAHTLWDGRTLARSRVQGRAVGRAALEDYAYAAYGLAAWAEWSGARRDAALARDIARAGWRRFYGASGWQLGESGPLAAETGQDVVGDGPMPSPSALLIETSLRLAERTGDRDLRRRALAALNSGTALIAGNPFWYATPAATLLRAAAVSP